MREIKYIAGRIREELEDAEGYTKHALEYKDSDWDFSQTLVGLAKQELTHSELLHNQAVKLIKDYREKNGPPPAAMAAVWDWEHEKMIEQTAYIKQLLEMHRG